MLTEEQLIERALEQAGIAMMARAKTAPKARGVDNLVYRLAEKNEIELIAQEIENLGIEKDVPFFIRDSRNIQPLQYIILIGTKDLSRGVPQCGFCGYENCGHKLKNIGRCAYDLIDLGLAVGSALSLGQQLGVDSRVMYTIGKAAMRLGFLREAEVALGIPLSMTEKSPFFDRLTTSL